MAQHRGIPVELMNELFASMPFENSIGLLANIPNGLLARNVQKMINGIKETMKSNKLNEKDCGTKLSISDDGLEAKHSGPNWGKNFVRTFLPIPAFNLQGFNKPIISFYYEMEILTIGIYPIMIGFWYNYVIWFNGSYKFGNADVNFKKGDFVGIGIIQYPKGKMQYFVTLNGQFLGKVKLPSAEFGQYQIYPAVDLRMSGDSIRAHFKKEEWQFKEFQRILEYKRIGQKKSKYEWKME